MRPGQGWGVEGMRRGGAGARATGWAKAQGPSLGGRRGGRGIWGEARWVGCLCELFSGDGGLQKPGWGLRVPHLLPVGVPQDVAAHDVDDVRLRVHFAHQAAQPLPEAGKGGAVTGASW